MSGNNRIHFARSYIPNRLAPGTAAKSSVLRVHVLIIMCNFRKFQYWTDMTDMTYMDEYINPRSEVLEVDVVRAIMEASAPLENPSEGDEWGWDD